MTLPPNEHINVPMEKLPKHVAIIMDGNGRWAESRGRDRTYGHLKGARVAKSTIETCAEIGIEHLTLYAFSTENWLRPKFEIAFLMSLLGRHLRKERANLVRNGIRFTTIGDLSRLPEAVAQEARRTIEATAQNSGMRLTFALSYGGRQEIANAARTLCERVARGEIQASDIDEAALAAELETAGFQDPDLIVRTSGERRLSNFMLWQAAYSELYVTEAFWPEFNETELSRALASYAARERRFGRTRAQQPLSPTAQKSNSPEAQKPVRSASGRALEILHAFGK